MLTLDNTSETIKRDQTYLDRDMTSSGTITVTPKADRPVSEEILNVSVTCKKYGRSFRNMMGRGRTKEGRRLTSFEGIGRNFSL